MRVIKFRGKLLRDGEWIYGSLIAGTTDKGTEVAFIVPTLPMYMVDPNTVGQFTGLHDKNGKEIFKGDIVRHDENGKCYSIIYEEPMFRFAPNDDCFAFLNHPELLEVVGNIHDNKSLIEKGDNQ